MAGKFIWYELMTADAEAAKAFYRAVVGWEVEDLGGPHAGYTLLKAPGGNTVGGMMALQGEACGGRRAAGLVRLCRRPRRRRGGAADRGGRRRVLRAPDDIPEVGRFAVVADPGGAAFMLLAPTPRGDAPQPAPRMSPGHVGWHELYADDGDAAFRFYADQFRWSEVSVMDMGPMGTYRLWSAGGDDAVGGMMTRPPQMPRPAWLFYFVVDSVEAAASRIGANGGQVTNGPMQVPDGSWVVQGLDPQGATFALVSEQR